MPVFSFKWLGKKFISIRPGDWGYIFSIIIEKELAANSGYLIFIDSNKDLFNPLFFDELSDHFPERNFPLLFIGTSPIFDHSIESRFDRRYLFIDSSILSKYFIAEKLGSLIEKIKLHISRFETYFSWGVSMECMDLSLRLLKESKLSPQGTHASNVSPFLFHSETRMRSQTNTYRDIELFYNKQNKCIVTNSLKLNFRILVIDDKIEKGKECKAKLLKRLLELNFDQDLRQQVSWKTPNLDENIVEILSIVENENKEKECYHGGIKVPNISLNTTAFIKNLDSSKIQIIAVRTLKDAKELLANPLLRFDLIMMDYLLDRKNDGTREYATEFWGDGNKKFFELSPVDGNSDDYKHIKESYDRIKANRGPMHRLWIFPITAFNQTFIDDLRNKGVRLIDYYWYLSRGADPINTPYLFINSLNKFLQLQLEHAIFDTRKIIGFLEKSMEGLKIINTLDDFNTFMAAEYTVFMEKYMMRPVIARDKKAGSLFADYVWKEFYAKEERKNLFILTEYINKFYHRCAFGTKGDIEKMITFWRELNSFFLENFSSEQESQKLNLNEYLAVLKRISDRI